MAHYYSVYGALELGPPMVEALTKALGENKDENPHISSWLLHADGGWSSFAFFGHTVAAAALDNVRSQVRRIAAITSTDQEYTNHVSGHFRVESDDPDRPSFTWHIDGGVLLEEPRA